MTTALRENEPLIYTRSVERAVYISLMSLNVAHSLIYTGEHTTHYMHAIKKNIIECIGCFISGLLLTSERTHHSPEKIPASHPPLPPQVITINNS